MDAIKLHPIKKIRLFLIFILATIILSVIISYKIEIIKLENDLEEKHDNESKDILLYLSNDIVKATSFLKVLINKDDIEFFKRKNNFSNKISFKIIKDYALIFNENKKISQETPKLEVKRYGSEDYILIREVKDNRNLSLEFSLTSFLRSINKNDYYKINKKINFTTIKPEKNANYYINYEQLFDNYFLVIQERKKGGFR